MTDVEFQIGKTQDLVSESKSLISFLRAFIANKQESHDPQLFEDEVFGFSQTCYLLDDKLNLIDEELEKFRGY